MLVIVNIVIIILCVVTYALMLYFRVKGDVTGAVSELIALAESTGLTGKEKMAQVVAALYKKVPAALKKILNEDRLESIAQWIFDWMRKYADNYIEATAKAEEGQSDDAVQRAIDEVHCEAIAALVSELFNLTLPLLKEKAESYGVSLDGLETRKDIIKAITKALIAGSANT